MSMEYKLPFTAKEVEEVLVKGKEVLPNIEQYKGLELIGTFIDPIKVTRDEYSSEYYYNTDEDFRKAIVEENPKIIYMYCTDLEKAPITWCTQDTVTWECDCDIKFTCGDVNDSNNGLSHGLRELLSWCTGVRFELYR